jgi:alanine transaminase
LGLIDPARTHEQRPGGLQLVSFHSISKGFTGECGRRGGYFELAGFDERVRGELYKLASISLCANSTGQLLMGLQSVPPAPGDASYDLFVRERDGILSSLRRRARRLSAAMAELEGASCEAAEGALYAFPRIRLSAKAIAAAAAAGKAPDAFYCLQLLDAKGIVVVPGSGFGQRDGTAHFRSTILPPEADLDRVIADFKAFHADFMARYR